MNNFFLPPPLPNPLCFLFCVCFDPGPRGGLLCGEARTGVALPACYFWRQRRLVALGEDGVQLSGSKTQEPV